MSWIFVLGLSLIVIGFVLIIIFIKTEWDAGALWIMVPCLIVAGIIFNVLSCANGAVIVNKIYAAADDQGLTVTTSVWGQTPWATEPCRFKLRYDVDKDKLYLAGADVLATPEVLEGICK